MNEQIYTPNEEQIFSTHNKNRLVRLSRHIKIETLNQTGWSTTLYNKKLLLITLMLGEKIDTLENLETFYKTQKLLFNVYKLED